MRQGFIIGILIAALGAACAVPTVLNAAPFRTIDPVSLNQVPVPTPANLAAFVRSEGVAVVLGKALFWDMQLGSDGMVACATCHHHAGTDGRTRNTLHPGVNRTIDGAGANSELTLEDFPFVRFADPTDRQSARNVRDDRVGTQGVNKTRFLGVVEGASAEPGRSLRDGEFTRHGRNLRQSTGRNAPTTINAVFNFTNFWDGRANHFFNGVNPFGIVDVEARVWRNVAGVLTPISLVEDLANNPFALDNASLASQAVNPVLSDVEMSWLGRTWPEVGRKLLSLRPLALQDVHPQDSRLALLRHADGKGLITTYAELIEAAFVPEFWNSSEDVDGFSQMEANFSLFFGLAVQLYQTTLVADQTPFDRFLQGDVTAMSERAERGMNIFFSDAAGCLNCHAGAELTGASVSLAQAPGEAGLIELMSMGDGNLGNYDIGFYNAAVTPTADDPGRGGRVVLNGVDMPLSFTGQHFERGTLPFTPIAQPGCVNDFLADPPTICPPANDVITRQSVMGAFKTPGLRNVELTGPYMHDGGMLTLMQVVDFYTRGGNFHEENLADLDPFIDTIELLRDDPEQREELVDFLLALTDERVRQKSAPFDHPQLFIVDGHEERIPGNPKRTRVLADRVVEIPAVGRFGRQSQGLPEIRPFLAPENMTSSEFHYLP